MDYNEKLKQIFAELAFIKISQLGKIIGMDASNINGYIKGNKNCTEKTYRKIIAGLEKCKISFINVLENKI